ncbi:MAG: hypothetical protein KGZ75_14445 [Syntrophomonadaceae bacterium]|nr:hypothetical protein [Syntrophomonadaceae bacterium]
MDNKNRRYDIVVSDEATQMLVSHARFLAKVSESVYTIKRANPVIMA